MSDIIARKHALRRAAQERRRTASDAAPDAAVSVAAHVRALATRCAGPAGVASGYLPVRGELDPRPAMAALAALGWRLALPVVVGRALPLVFRPWHPGAATVAAAFGLEVPAEDTEVVPDLLLVPMLAYDLRGHRLGYGGGFYDRTLAALRAARPATCAVGIAYAGQRVSTLPDTETDMRLDAIVTELGPVALA